MNLTNREVCSSTKRIEKCCIKIKQRSGFFYLFRGNRKVLALLSLTYIFLASCYLSIKISMNSTKSCINSMKFI